MSVCSFCQNCSTIRFYRYVGRRNYRLPLTLTMLIITESSRFARRMVCVMVKRQTSRPSSPRRLPDPLCVAEFGRIYGWQVDARTWMKLALQTSLVESSVVQIESSLIMYEIASQILFQHVQFQASHFLLICAYNSKHHLCLYNSKHFCRVPQTYKNTECVVFKRHYKSFWQWTLVKCWMIKTFTKLVCNPAQTFVQMLILTNRVSQTFSKSSCVSPFLWIPFPRYSPFFLVSNLFFIPI